MAMPGIPLAAELFHLQQAFFRAWRGNAWLGKSVHGKAWLSFMNETLCDGLFSWLGLAGQCKASRGEARRSEV